MCHQHVVCAPLLIFSRCIFPLIQMLSRSRALVRSVPVRSFLPLRGLSTSAPLFPSKEPYSAFVPDYTPAQSSYDRLRTVSASDYELYGVAPGQVTTSPMMQRMELFIRGLQKSITSSLEAIEAANLSPSCSRTHGRTGKTFTFEPHSRNPATGMSGGGITAVLQDGAVYEKAGVNVSVLNGRMPLSRLSNMRAEHKDLDHQLSQLPPTATSEEGALFPFAVSGISLVLHPHSPKVPTVHANFRLFELTVGDRSVWWFGGGADLTPTYVVPEDARHFHGTLKAASDAADPSNGGNTAADGSGPVGPVSKGSDSSKGGELYPRFKAWADEYFRIPHRDNECRGIGGMFFDDFDSSSGMTQEQVFRYVTARGDAFCAAYFPIVRAHVGEAWTEEERRFQQLRRGRYVEFNVMYDRGTKFGLQMPKSAEVKTESILMSLPLTARFEYKHAPEAGSAEAETLDVLRNPREWA